MDEGAGETKGASHRGEGVVQNGRLKRILDPQYFTESLFWIVDKMSKKVPFLWNQAQKKFWKGHTRRDVIVKARKMGFSAVITAIFLHACLTRENTRAVIVSHEEEATKRMLARVKYYLDTCDVKATVSKNSERELGFPDTNSSIWIGSAGQRSFGRGDDITHAHLSEFCHYPNEEVLTSITEALTDDSWLVAESTAKGAGTPSYDFWMRSIRGENDFRPHFFPWFGDPEYRLRVSGTFTVTKEEKRLIEMFGLDLEQINWRRWKIRNMINPDLFPQEFPSTWEEAFLTAGLRVFDWMDILRLEKLKESRNITPKIVGEIEDRGRKVVIEPDVRGRLTVFKDPPNDRAKYLISADASDGIDGADKSSADVIDLETWEQVAHWNGYMAPNEFGKMLYNLGARYNWAIIAQEDNYPGNAVNAKLEDMGYPRMWVGSEGKYWKTTTKTRPLMISDLKEVIGDQSLIINSFKSLTELKTFVKSSSGKLEADKGCNDDCVISMAIGSHILKQISYDPELRSASIDKRFRKRRPWQRGGDSYYRKGGVV